jgi:peptidoglycan/xylan/chitin deacetylase (PgdA/CDA1 family)
VATEPRYYVDDAGPMAIALTLDDGPDPVYTPQVLEILEQYDIKATFNMIGEQIRGNLSLVGEVSAAGHTITNHTWDHADMRRYSVSRIISEIDACNDALADAGQQPTIFRAPYGYWTPAVFQACAARGLTPLGWSVDPQDWNTARVNTQDIVRTVLKTTHAHDIILEHDGGGDRSNTVAALRIFIPELLARGFVFAPV